MPLLLTVLRRHTDNLFVGYLLVTGLLVAIFRERVTAWEILLLVHLLGAGAVFGLRFAPDALREPWRFLRWWYPALVSPLLYQEVELLAAAFGDWRLTGSIHELEGRLFGGQPSIYLSETFAWVGLSEYLHFCYLFFLLLFPLVGGYLYFKRESEVFGELVFLFSATYLANYLFYILLPVDSPFYRADRLAPPLTGHLFYELVQVVSGNAGARGGAFPSSHVSIATVIWLVAWRHQRKLAWWLLPIVLGLIVATVYGRFHYALDVLAGLLVAGAVIVVFRRFEATRRPKESAAPS